MSPGRHWAATRQTCSSHIFAPRERKPPSRRHGGRESGRYQDRQRAARQRRVQPVLHGERLAVPVVRPRPSPPREPVRAFSPRAPVKASAFTTRGIDRTARDLGDANARAPGPRRRAPRLGIHARASMRATAPERVASLGASRPAPTTGPAQNIILRRDAPFPSRGSFASSRAFIPIRRFLLSPIARACADLDTS